MPLLQIQSAQHVQEGNTRFEAQSDPPQPHAGLNGDCDAASSPHVERDANNRVILNTHRGNLRVPNGSYCRTVGPRAHIIYEPPDVNDVPTMDIVLVHGLNSGEISCWQRDEDDTLWPGHYLPQDFPTCRIITMGYQSGMIKSGEGADLNLLDAIIGVNGTNNNACEGEGGTANASETAPKTSQMSTVDRSLSSSSSSPPPPPSSSSSGPTAFTIDDAARLLHDTLLSPSVNIGGIALDPFEDTRPHRPVLFVVHSLGGLVVKQLLLDLNDSESETALGVAMDRSFLGCIKGLVFYGTPHFGSSIARYLNYTDGALLSAFHATTQRLFASSSSASTPSLTPATADDDANMLSREALGEVISQHVDGVSSAGLSGLEFGRGPSPPAIGERADADEAAVIAIAMKEAAADTQFLGQGISSSGNGKSGGGAKVATIIKTLSDNNLLHLHRLNRHFLRIVSALQIPVLCFGEGEKVRGIIKIVKPDSSDPLFPYRNADGSLMLHPQLPKGEVIDFSLFEHIIVEDRAHMHVNMPSSKAHIIYSKLHSFIADRVMHGQMMPSVGIPNDFMLQTSGGNNKPFNAMPLEHSSQPLPSSSSHNPAAVEALLKDIDVMWSEILDLLRAASVFSSMSSPSSLSSATTFNSSSKLDGALKRPSVTAFVKSEDDGPPPSNPLPPTPEDGTAKAPRLNVSSPRTQAVVPSSVFTALVIAEDLLAMPSNSRRLGNVVVVRFWIRELMHVIRGVLSPPPIEPSISDATTTTAVPHRNSPPRTVKATNLCRSISSFELQRIRLLKESLFHCLGVLGRVDNPPINVSQPMHQAFLLASLVSLHERMWDYRQAPRSLSPLACLDSLAWGKAIATAESMDKAAEDINIAEEDGNAANGASSSAAKGFAVRGQVLGGTRKQQQQELPTIPHDIGLNEAVACITAVALTTEYPSAATRDLLRREEGCTLFGKGRSLTSANADDILSSSPLRALLSSDPDALLCSSSLVTSFLQALDWDTPHPTPLFGAEGVGKDDATGLGANSKGRGGDAGGGDGGFVERMLRTLIGGIVGGGDATNDKSTFTSPKQTTLGVSSPKSSGLQQRGKGAQAASFSSSAAVTDAAVEQTSRVQESPAGREEGGAPKNGGLHALPTDESTSVSSLASSGDRCQRLSLLSSDKPIAELHQWQCNAHQLVAALAHWMLCSAYSELMAFVPEEEDGEEAVGGGSGHSPPSHPLQPLSVHTLRLMEECIVGITYRYAHAGAAEEALLSSLPASTRLVCRSVRYYREPPACEMVRCFLLQQTASHEFSLCLKHSRRAIRRALTPTAGGVRARGAANSNDHHHGTTSSSEGGGGYRTAFEAVTSRGVVAEGMAQVIISDRTAKVVESSAVRDGVVGVETKKDGVVRKDAEVISDVTSTTLLRASSERGEAANTIRVSSSSPSQAGGIVLKPSPPHIVSAREEAIRGFVESNPNLRTIWSDLHMLTFCMDVEVSLIEGTLARLAKQMGIVPSRSPTLLSGPFALALTYDKAMHSRPVVPLLPEEGGGGGVVLSPPPSVTAGAAKKGSLAQPHPALALLATDRALGQRNAQQSSSSSSSSSSSALGSNSSSIARGLSWLASAITGAVGGSGGGTTAGPNMPSNASATSFAASSLSSLSSSSSTSPTVLSHTPFYFTNRPLSLFPKEEMTSLASEINAAVYEPWIVGTSVANKLQRIRVGREADYGGRGEDATAIRVQVPVHEDVFIYCKKVFGTASAIVAHRLPTTASLPSGSQGGVGNSRPPASLALNRAVVDSSFIDPTDPSLAALKGRTAFMMGDYSSAISHFRRQVEATERSRHHRPDSYLTPAIANDPRVALAWSYLGRAARSRTNRGILRIVERAVEEGWRRIAEVRKEVTRELVSQHSKDTPATHSNETTVDGIRVASSANRPLAFSTLVTSLFGGGGGDAAPADNPLLTTPSSPEIPAGHSPRYHRLHSTRDPPSTSAPIIRWRDALNDIALRPEIALFEALTSLHLGGGGAITDHIPNSTHDSNTSEKRRNSRAFNSASDELAALEATQAELEAIVSDGTQRGHHHAHHGVAGGEGRGGDDISDVHIALDIFTSVLKEAPNDVWSLCGKGRCLTLMLRGGGGGGGDGDGRPETSCLGDHNNDYRHRAGLPPLRFSAYDATLMRQAVVAFVRCLDLSDGQCHYAAHFLGELAPCIPMLFTNEAYSALSTRGFEHHIAKKDSGGGGSAEGAADDRGAKGSATPRREDVSSKEASVLVCTEEGDVTFPIASPTITAAPPAAQHTSFPPTPLSSLLPTWLFHTRPARVSKGVPCSGATEEADSSPFSQTSDDHLQRLNPFHPLCPSFAYRPFMEPAPFVWCRMLSPIEQYYYTNSHSGWSSISACVKVTNRRAAGRGWDGPSSPSDLHETALLACKQPIPPPSPLMTTPTSFSLSKVFGSRFGSNTVKRGEANNGTGQDAVPASTTAVGKPSDFAAEDMQILYPFLERALTNEPRNVWGQAVNYIWALHGAVQSHPHPSAMLSSGSSSLPSSSLSPSVAVARKQLLGALRHRMCRM